MVGLSLGHGPLSTLPKMYPCCCEEKFMMHMYGVVCYTTDMVIEKRKQEAQLMLTTGSTRLAVSRGQQTWYHSTCHI